MKTDNQSKNTRDKEHIWPINEAQKKKSLTKDFLSDIIKTLGDKILFGSTMD